MLHWTDLGRASKEKNMWFCNLPIPTVWTSSPEGKPCGFWDFILWCFDLFFLFGTTCDVSIWFCGSWGHNVSGWYLAEICVWLMQCAKTLNQICRPQRLEARWQGAGASQARTQHGLLQPGATGRQGHMGTLRWVSPGWWREGGVATCSWLILSSSIATSAGQHGGYAHKPAISSYHSDSIYGW